MEQLEQKLIIILEKALQAAEKTGEFVINEAPDVLREFYLFHTIEHILGILLGSFLILVGWTIFKKTGSKKEITEYGETCPKFLGKYYNMNMQFSAFTFLTIFVVASTILLFINIYGLVYILTAPKLYLIEYFI